eukprot:CAMPEP_0119403834 /NCGR_PEP_ID=MMETSP1334-20130426/143584_1 /TAXON_ID=127549 /ORGANISM="Calcidiscus leptoporus, Strain RCC1130" /LENGTH=226 /DNA_ID=CAMNT_0007427785 /DNA_START=63 /DNA_END=744 /DNA_ORIENTATION=-
MARLSTQLDSQHDEKSCSAVSARCWRAELCADGALLATCPWGNEYVLRQASESFAVVGCHAGGCGSLVGMQCVRHLVRAGAARVLCAFWRSVLGCAASLRRRAEADECVVAFESGQELCAPHSMSACGMHTCVRAEADECVVAFESGQELCFEESRDAAAADAYDHEEEAGYHLALYMPSADAFSRAYGRAHASRLVYSNPRFEGGPPEFSNAVTWAEAEDAANFE